MNKDRQIVSELRIFFTESGCGLGTQRSVPLPYCRTYGLTQMLIDFTLLEEDGRVSSRPQGLSKKDIEARFKKMLDAESKVEKHKEEYFQDKISSMKKMLTNASIEHLGFDYLLVDSCSQARRLSTISDAKGASPI